MVIYSSKVVIIITRSELIAHIDEAKVLTHSASQVLSLSGSGSNDPDDDKNDLSLL